MKLLTAYIALALALTGCGTAGTVKVWYLEPAQGLIRKQAKPPEVKTFPAAKGYFCESPSDFEETVGCVSGAAKVYYLDPARGLVRKQSNEVHPFTEVRGYFCVSPADLKVIIDKCLPESARGADLR